MTFGENVKALRTARSMSQKDLAEKLGFSFQNISKWERNESLPDIETLIAIAAFFETTTDSLLGYSREKPFSTLMLDKNELTVYTQYTEKKENLTRKLIFAVDEEGKIASIVFVPNMRRYRDGYTRENYEICDEKSTLIYECSFILGKEKVVENKRIKIPDNGFLIAVSDSAYAAKKIMEFIIPEEYSEYLNPDSHAGYYNSRNGKFLFSDILKHNELDHITVELTNGNVLFKKPAQTVDPMSVNIDFLAKIVRKEIKKEHDKQIEELKNKLDDIEDLAEDNDGNIEALEERINALENQLAELKASLNNK